MLQKTKALELQREARRYPAGNLKPGTGWAHLGPEREKKPRERVGSIVRVPHWKNRRTEAEASKGSTS